MCHYYINNVSFTSHNSLQAFFVFIICHVKMKRSDSHISMFKCPRVTFHIICIVRSIIACYPVILATSGVVSLLPFLIPIAHTHLADLHTLQWSDIRHIHIQASIIWQTLSEHHVNDFLHPLLHRSEEHTSELQSPDHLVCRLL